MIFEHIKILFKQYMRSPSTFICLSPLLTFVKIYSFVNLFTKICPERSFLKMSKSVFFQKSFSSNKACAGAKVSVWWLYKWYIIYQGREYLFNLSWGSQFSIQEVQEKHIIWIILFFKKPQFLVLFKIIFFSFCPHHSVKR